MEQGLDDLMKFLTGQENTVEQEEADRSATALTRHRRRSSNTGSIGRSSTYQSVISNNNNTPTEVSRITERNQEVSLERLSGNISRLSETIRDATELSRIRSAILSRWADGLSFGNVIRPSIRNPVETLLYELPLQRTSAVSNNGDDDDDSDLYE